MLTMLTMLRRATKGPDSPCLQKLNPTQELPFHLGAHTVDRMGKQSHKILPENSCLSWVYSPHQCWWTIPLLSQRKISEMIFADGMLCQSRLFTTSYSSLANTSIASLLSSRWQSRPAGIHADKRLQVARNGAKTSAREATHLQQMPHGKNQTMRYLFLNICKLLFK